MTARPQDVALLPLPAVLWQWLSRHASEQDANDVAEAVRHYARANVTAALASAQAREEELLAEALEWRDMLTAEKARAERLAEAFRLAVTRNSRGLLLSAEQIAEFGQLSTNAAQPGETT